MSGIHLFTLSEIPVRVSPWYPLLVIYLTYSYTGSPRLAMLYAVGVTVSLLAHELGHALVARHFKLQPHVMLTGLGGVTGHERATRPRDDALIVAAGPFAGFALAALCYALLRYVDMPAGPVRMVLANLALLNVFWSVFNLLPMWPMDGGQLLRIGANKLWQPTLGNRITHIVSILVVLAVAGLLYKLNWTNSPMMLIILALMTWQNVQALQAGAGATVHVENPLARELLGQAERAYQEGNDDKAALLCHQLRDQPSVSPQLLARCWAILGVTATRAGRYEEALSYLRRAPDMSDVVEATAQCFYELGMYDALEALAGTNAFARLPSDTRETILTALRDSPSTGPA